MQTVRWGILGPGKISRSFAAALQEAQGAELVAVGSRNLNRASAFAAEFGDAIYAAGKIRHDNYFSITYQWNTR